MFDLILHAIIFSTFLILAVSLESCPPKATFSRCNPDSISIVSRFLIVLVAFPWITATSLRAAEKALRGLGAKLLLYGGAFIGRTYISEILLSAFISILLLGSSSARRLTRRLVRRALKFKASKVGAEFSNGTS